MGEANGNDGAIEAWNTILFEKFVAFRPVVSGALGLHGTRAIEKLAPPRGAKLVDIGCGFGDTTLELADRVGPEGHVTGVDAAPSFIDVARHEAGGRGNVRYEVADVQAAVPGGPYDAAYSRMGTMFFASPVFALRNIRKVVKPGGTLCMVVWRKKDANAGFYNAEVAVKSILGDPDHGDQVTCGPGPFSMASADLVSEQLLAAGYVEVDFRRSDGEMFIGNTVEDAISFALSVGPAGEVVRLSGQLAIDKQRELDAALRATIAPMARPDGTIWAGSSCWIVTARVPS